MLQFSRSASLRRVASLAGVRPIVFRAFASKAANIKEFEIRACDTYMIDGPATKTKATKDECMQYLKDMLIMRKLELKADDLYKEQKIRGFCHLYDGQEAVAVGMEAGMTREDGLITAYREHCQQIARGDTPKSVLAELMGRRDGCAFGKGGSMHMYLPENKFFGGNGIVGAQVPLGTGIALAEKLQGKKNVCFAMYGDGASNQGQVFEAFNIAKLWNIPIVYVCENNKYGMGTSAERSSAETRYYIRGQYFPGLRVDGMDVLAVREATKYAREYALENGPILLEMETYRYHGHSMSDPGKSYRSADEVKSIRSTNDPIEKLKRSMVEAGWITEEAFEDLEDSTDEIIDAAAEEAEASPEPDLSELTTNIYNKEEPPFLRHVELDASVRA